MADWMPPAESVDAALLPSLRLGNARADDLVRNNGIAANAVALHKDHIVGHLFLISYRPNWRYLGMRESAAKSFVDEVEAAWTEYCDGIFGEMDAEGKRTFTEFIREGVGVHAFNGEIFLQPVWDAETTQVFRTRFKAVSPKRVDTPGYARGNRQLRAGVETDRNGKALAYHVCDDDWPVAGGERWTRIPRFLPSGRPAMLHIFEPVEDGQTRGANQFYSVMERLKMLDTLQATQLQSAIVKAMYAATIESELDSEKAFEYITAADNKDTPLVNMLANYARYYSTNSIKLGGVKIPHLYPGDELNLQTAQDSDNGFSALEQALLRYIAAGLGSLMSSFRVIILRSAIPAPAHLPMSPGAISGAAPVHCRTAGDTNVFLLAGGGADTGSYPGTPGQVFLLGGPIQLEPLGVDWCRTYGD